MKLVMLGFLFSILLLPVYGLDLTVKPLRQVEHCNLLPKLPTALQLMIYKFLRPVEITDAYAGLHKVKLSDISLLMSRRLKFMDCLVPHCVQLSCSQGIVTCITPNYHLAWNSYGPDKGKYTLHFIFDRFFAEAHDMRIVGHTTPDPYNPHVEHTLLYRQHISSDSQNNRVTDTEEDLTVIINNRYAARLAQNGLWAVWYGHRYVLGYMKHFFSDYTGKQKIDNVVISPEGCCVGVQLKHCFRAYNCSASDIQLTHAWKFPSESTAGTLAGQCIIGLEHDQAEHRHILTTRAILKTTKRPVIIKYAAENGMQLAMVRLPIEGYKKLWKRLITYQSDAGDIVICPKRHKEALAPALPILLLPHNGMYPYHVITLGYNESVYKLHLSEDGAWITRTSDTGLVTTHLSLQPFMEPLISSAHKMYLESEIVGQDRPFKISGNSENVAVCTREL